MTRGVGGDSPANVSSYLKNIDFPANQDQLIEHAQGNGADSEVLEIIRNMPEQEYRNMADVMKAYGDVR